MNFRIHDIKELDSLFPHDRELVIKEYEKQEHSYQIELKVLGMIITIPMVIFIEIFFEKAIEIEFGSTFVKLLLLGVIAGIIFNIVSRTIEYNFIAPKVIRKIIENIDEIKKTSNQALQNKPIRPRWYR